MEKFTHLAEIYGIPCYFNEDTMEIKGTNWFYDLLIDARVGFESLFPLDEAFKIKIIRQL